VGVEVNQDAADQCVARGLEVWSRSIEQIAAESAGAFDAVVAFQVVEHVADPLPLLEATSQLLRTGGILVLSVPNNDSVLFDQFDPLNAPPHHMGLWNLRALLWLERVLPLRTIDVQYQPMTRAMPLSLLSNDAVRANAYRSRSRRIARRLLGEDRLLQLGSPWIRAALALAPGHSIQVTYERVDR
jgi:SAM-dependent methyltransferase